MAEHRALEAGWADVDSEQVEQVVGAECLDPGDRLALDLVRQQRRRCLADCAAATGEADSLNDTVVDPKHHRDPVAAQRIRALEARGRVLDDAEVMGPPVVLQDVVAIKVVH